MEARLILDIGSTYDYSPVLAGVVDKAVGLICGGDHSPSLKWVQKTEIMCTTCKDPGTKMVSPQVID